MTAKKAAEPKPRPRNAVLGEDEWHFGPSWKRSTGDFVESHCGRWWITPIYAGCTRPQDYELRLDNRIVGGGKTQRECKKEAEWICTHHA